MSFSVRQENSHCNITASDDLTIGEADAFLQFLRSCLEGESVCEKLTLDLAAVGEFDTSALQILVSLRQTLKAKSVALTIENPAASVLELFELMGLSVYLGDDSGLGETDGT